MGEKRMVHSAASGSIPGGPRYKAGVARPTYASALPVTFDLDGNQSQLAKRLIGRRFGHLTVLGVAAMDRGERTSNGWSRRLRWVVRCKCGNYEHRRTGAIGSPKNMGDRCLPCEQERRKRDEAEGGVNPNQGHHP